LDYYALNPNFPEDSTLVGLVVVMWPITIGLWLVYWLFVCPLNYLFQGLGWIVNNCKVCEKKDLK
jgi:hypothetical protein